MTESRANSGRFVAGKSGNPHGRPKIPKDVKEAYRSLAPEAVNTLADVMRNGRRDADRKDAAIAILDRAYGKPVQMQAVSVDVSEMQDVTAQIRRVLLESEDDRYGAEGTD